MDTFRVLSICSIVVLAGKVRSTDHTTSPVAPGSPSIASVLLVGLPPAVYWGEIVASFASPTHANDKAAELDFPLTVTFPPVLSAAIDDPLSMDIYSGSASCVTL